MRHIVNRLAAFSDRAAAAVARHPRCVGGAAIGLALASLVLAVVGSAEDPGPGGPAIDPDRAGAAAFYAAEVAGDRGGALVSPLTAAGRAVELGRVARRLRTEEHALATARDAAEAEAAYWRQLADRARREAASWDEVASASTSQLAAIAAQREALEAGRDAYASRLAGVAFLAALAAASLSAAVLAAAAFRRRRAAARSADADAAPVFGFVGPAATADTEVGMV